MLELLYALLGGIALVLIPYFFVDYASGEQDKNHLIAFAIVALLGMIASLYLAFSFWLFGFFPVFALSSLATFYLYKRQSPDFVVESNLLDDAVSDDLKSKLSEELKRKK